MLGGERSPGLAFEGRSARSPTDEAGWNSVRKDKEREGGDDDEARGLEYFQIKVFSEGLIFI